MEKSFSLNPKSYLELTIMDYQLKPSENKSQMDEELSQLSPKFFSEWWEIM